MMQVFEGYLGIYEYSTINEHRMPNALHESLEYGCDTRITTKSDRMSVLLTVQARHAGLPARRLSLHFNRESVLRNHKVTTRR